MIDTCRNDFTKIKDRELLIPESFYLNNTYNKSLQKFLSKNDEKKLDVYEDFPILYKKYYFYYYGKKVMTYYMVKKTVFKFPTERYLNIVKKGYRDCKLDIKYLHQGLKSNK